MGAELPKIVRRWTEGVWEHDDRALAWMRTRPMVIQELMLLFPPNCVVRGKRPLNCPAPGRFGVVASLFENGRVAVCDLELALIHPHGPYFCGDCDPEWIEVVAYWRGWTPERVKRVLAH